MGSVISMRSQLKLFVLFNQRKTFDSPLRNTVFVTLLNEHVIFICLIKYITYIDKYTDNSFIF